MIFISFIAKLVGTAFKNTPAGLWHVEPEGDVRREIRVLPMFMRIAKFSPSYVQVTVAHDRWKAWLHTCRLCTPIVEPSCPRWDWDYKWGRLLLWFYVLIIHCTATPLNLKARTGPMLSAHGTLFVCVCVGWASNCQSQKITWNYLPNTPGNSLKHRRHRLLDTPGMLTSTSKSPELQFVAPDFQSPIVIVRTC